MENENRIGLNEKFVFFMGEIINKDIMNKEDIEKVYSEIVGLKFENIGRVYSRVMREELRDIREEMFKEIGVEEKDFVEMGERIKVFVGDEKRKYRWVSSE